VTELNTGQSPNQPTDLATAKSPLLHVQALRTYFTDGESVAHAVDGVSFNIRRGETVGIVGESGSGKSVTALSLLRLIRPPGMIQPGSRIEFEGIDLLTLDDAAMRTIRGDRIAMIFQEPMSALNPVLTVGDQVAEVLRVHTQLSRHDAWERTIEMLTLTGIPDPRERARQYPHQLSGGMRQRIMIAMALMMHPALLIADEPTTALDVTIQAQILELLRELQAKFGMAILFITHDLGVVAEMAERVVVMYGGEVVEETSTAQIFAEAHHPYTQGLMRAMPQLGIHRERLLTIPGVVPAPTAWPSGCRFRDRCQYAWERCVEEHPPLYQIGIGHSSRCHLADSPERRDATTRSLEQKQGIGEKTV
jgi:oligopeptide/dipeptide ABC transporter ATP-binding protein